MRGRTVPASHAPPFRRIAGLLGGLLGGPLLCGGVVTILVTGDVHVAKVWLAALLLSGLGVPAALR